MSNHFISINRGFTDGPDNLITTGAASTAGDDLEVRIADAASLTKQDVDLLLERIQRYVRETSNFPDL